MDGRRPPPLHRTIIAHASALARSGLRMVLEQEDDIRVDGEATDAATAGRLARRLLPRFVILQDRLIVAGFTGPLPPSTALVVVGTGTGQAAVDAARRPGAAAYLRLEHADVGLVPVLRELAATTAG